MARHPAKCPKCGGRLEYESVADGKTVCPTCQVLLCVPGKEKPSDKVDPLLGQSLGEFKLVELLGRGGTGAVYKARQSALDRFVAVKVLPSTLVRDAEFIERFQREARDAAAISHPNIVQVLTVGQDKGYQFIAMELVEGESLAEVLKRDGPLPADRALGLLRQVTGALAEVHGKGIVLRDIQPANILLTAKGLAKLSDFGLAKHTAADVAVTQTGAMMDTPLYFPPEAARGRRLDARSDLYLLGCTFYHVLAGRPPFEADTPEALALKHVREEPAPLNVAAPNTPLGLCHLIHHLLRTNPDERFQTADDLVGALERIESQLEAERHPAASAAGAEPVGATAPASRPVKRVLVASLVLVFLVEAACVAFLLGRGHKPLARPPVSTATPVPAEKPKAKASTEVAPGPRVEEPTPEPLKPKPEQKKEEPPQPEPKKEEPPKPEPPKPEPPAPEPKTTAKEDEDAKRAAEEEREREAEAARREDLARAGAAYAQESEKVWALFTERNYAGAEKLLGALAARAEFRPVAAALKADAEALALLKEFWAAAERGLAARKGRFIAFGGAGGAIVDAKDGKVTLRVRGAEVSLPIHKLAAKQALACTELKADGRPSLMRAVLLLADGTALDEAAAALDKAGDEPSAAVYKERLDALKMGAAEAAAQRAWLHIQEEAKAKLTPATAKRLTDLLAAFDKAHGGSKLHKSLADELAALKTRVEASLGYTTWPFDEAEAKRRQRATADALRVKVEEDVDLGRGVKMAVVLIPAGEFLMGSPLTTSPERLAAAYGGTAADYEGEFPQHRVKISRPFWIGKTEVTQEQWMTLSPTNPSRFKDNPQNPVENVSWTQAHGFAKDLSEKLGKRCRLPTEAEWEYACRAGADTEYYFGNEAGKLNGFAWCSPSPQPVGMKKPNAWGLFDVAGNVSEWVEDWDGKYGGGAQADPIGAPAGGRRVLRGGASYVYGIARSMRSAYRNTGLPGQGNYYLGFRVVLAAGPR